MDDSIILTIHDWGATSSISISLTKNLYPAILKPSQKESNPSFSSAADSVSEYCSELSTKWTGQDKGD